MEKIPFVSIEGPIGIGKSTLSKAVAEKFGFVHLREIVEENPFLEKFYNDLEAWSFQTEMFFLCNRYKQLEDIQKQALEKGVGVSSDYHIFKNLIFAKRTLNEEQYEKYLSIYGILTADKPVPNVILYINASLETILNRIKKRGRIIEKGIDPMYIEQLSKDYDEYMAIFKKENPHVKVIQINGDEVDFVKNEEQLNDILMMIEKELK